MSVRFGGIFIVILLTRTARVTWIISVIQVFKFIGFVSVIKAVRVIVTHFAGTYCTYACRLWRSHSLHRGARRRQGCTGHPERKLCSLIRLALSH